MQQMPLQAWPEVPSSSGQQAAAAAAAASRHGPGNSSGSSALRGSSLLQAALAARGRGPGDAAPTELAAPASRASGGGVVPAGNEALGSSASGSPSHVCLRDVWPVHFSVPLHAVVLFCLTGMVWATLNAAGGLWQERFGEGTCFAGVPVPTV